MGINLEDKNKKEKFAKLTTSTAAVSCPICDRGDKFMIKNQYRKAVDEYLTSIMVHRDNTRAIKSVAQAYKKMKKYELAIKHLENAKTLSSFDYEIYYELGLNYLLNANPCLAIKNLTKSLRLNKNNLNAQIQLAISHEIAGEEEMALAIYQKIIEENPRTINAYNHKAGLYMQMGKFEPAKELFIQILKINPNYHRGYLGLGICLDRLGQEKKAVRYYKKYIAAKPKSETSYALVNRVCEIYSKSENRGARFLRIAK